MIRVSFSWLFIAALLLSACQPREAVPDLDQAGASPAAIPDQEDQQVPLIGDEDDRFSIYRPGLAESQQHLLEGLAEASFYNIEFRIGDDLLGVDGIVDVHYTNRESVPLDEIHFRLMPNVLGGQMQIYSLSVDKGPSEPVYDLNDSLMIVPLDDPLQPGESLDIQVEFFVKIPTEVESFYGLLTYYDGVLSLAHAYPMIAVYNHEGWNSEIPTDHGDAVFADASFFSVVVDAPSELVLAAAGREISREDDGNRQVVTFAAGPARDFYLAASPEYEVISQTVGDVTFNSYAPAGVQDGAQMAIDVAVDSFEFLGDFFSPYPYTEFDIVATPTLALGIEFPGLIILTGMIYPLEGSSYGTSNPVLMESTTVHEAVHQWFYNLVGNDQLDEPWLDEALTQYLSWQYYLEEYGKSGARGFEQYLEFRWERVNKQAIPIGKPVVEYPDSSYGAIVYGRGPFFFEALRDEMGSENFERFLKDYLISNSWEITTGEQLKNLAEEHCQCDLTLLFDAWVTP